jgi:quinoprotein glucose dehydrogenase
MLVYAATGGDGIPYLYAVDKRSGEQLSRIEVPRASRYGMMSYVHQGRQYIVLQTGSSLTAMALPN